MLVLSLALTTARGQESLPLKAVAAIKEATVMITTTAQANAGVGGSGSGFLIRVEGQTAYVVTNSHVISPRKGLSGGLSSIKVVLRRGTRAERKVAGDLVASSSARDLAIIKVTGVADLPAPIDVLKETELVETMPVYVFGFPFGEALALGRGSPSVVVGKASISSVRRDAGGRVSAVLIDGALNPGNSGGPIVDAQGRLVGVAEAAIPGANIGIAIARPDLLDMISGRPEGVHVTAGAVRDGAAELAIEVPLLDPFDHVKKISFLYEVGGAGAVKSRRRGQETTWDPLPGAKKIELKIGAQRACGSVAIATAPGKDVDLIYQLAFDDGRGGQLHTKPGHYFLSAPQAAAPGRSAAALRPWGDVINPDGDCKIQIGNGGLSVEVPGTHHELSTELDKVNAPRIVQEIEGDFVAQVRVRGEFHPAGPGTRIGGLPFNGAGLLVWLDAEHFLRMERAAVLSNDRIGAYLLIQRHEVDQPMLDNSAFLEEGDVYLKIERRGDHISGWYGTDGKEWAETKPIKVTWPARLKVGLDALNSAFSPLSVRFEEFSIRKLGPR